MQPEIVTPTAEEINAVLTRPSDECRDDALVDQAELLVEELKASQMTVPPGASYMGIATGMIYGMLVLKARGLRCS